MKKPTDSYGKSASAEAVQARLAELENDDKPLALEELRELEAASDARLEAVPKDANGYVFALHYHATERGYLRALYDADQLLAAAGTLQEVRQAERLLEQAERRLTRARREFGKRLKELQASP